MDDWTRKGLLGKWRCSLLEITLYLKDSIRSCLRDTIVEEENGISLERARAKTMVIRHRVVALKKGMYSISQRHAKVMGLRKELHLACFHNTSIETHK
jgi:hypothetical protein